MAEYKSDDRLPFGIPVSRREGSSAPQSLSSNTGTSTSEQPDSDVTIFVGRVNKQRRRPMTFRRDAKISHLTERIQQDYSLGVDDDIVVYEPTEIPGSISEPVEALVNLDRYQNRALVFHTPGPVDLDDIKQFCCEQNITFFGAMDHGKSSFINTLMRALGMQPCAPTYRSTATGTMVYTPYKIRLEESLSFTLWDVPGTAVGAIPPEQLQQTIESVLKGKEPKNIPIGSGTKWFSRNCQKIQAVVSIQKGTVATERLHSDFLRASTRTGRAIPLFVVMTHIDMMTPYEISAKEEEIATTVGIDRSNIFKIANYDHRGESVIRSRGDPQRDFHTRSILMKILAASKSYKEETGDSGDCNIM